MINDLKRKRQESSDSESSAQSRHIWESQGPIFLDGLATIARPIKSESRVKVGDSGIVCDVSGIAPNQLFTIDILERNVAVTVRRDILRPFGEPKVEPPKR